MKINYEQTSQTEIHNEKSLFSTPLREMKRIPLHSNIKNHQLPLLENDDFRGYRHTLDFSNIKRSSSISIYCTFTLNHKSSHNSLSSTISSDSSCMKNENNENMPLFLLKQGENNPYLLQKRLWDQDTSLCPRDQMAEYLGKKYVLLYHSWSVTNTLVTAHL